MKVILYGTAESTNELEARVKTSLDELGLVDFIQVELSQDEALKEKLNITQEPALVVEEEAIDFTDTIFEGMTPEAEEIKSMFISIIGGG